MTAAARSGTGTQRMLAAAWFAGWAMLAAGVMYLGPAAQRGWAAIVLWVVVPGLAAAPVGAWLGPLFLSHKGAGPWRSLALGALGAVLAHLLFAPAFAVGWWLTASGGTNVLALIPATATLGFAMVAPLTLPIGMLAGWLLYWLGRARR